jgi:hypothetical protein
VSSLDEAKRLANRQKWLGEADAEDEQRIEEARKKLEAETKWAQDMTQELRKRAAERARKQLGQSADSEDKMAERARKLAEQGRDQGSLPDSASEAIEDAEKAAREAAQALKNGDADRALERQREAQRKLEAAKQELQGNDEGGQSSPSTTGDGQELSRERADIPKAGAHKGPEDFRKRVMEGLGQPSSGSLRDAVRRYAEGLLR